MTKDAYYFPHDSNAKDDPKCVLLIEQLGLEGYGIYWVLIETLRDQPEYRYPLKLIPALARRYNTTAEKMKAVVTAYDLFEIDEEDFFLSPSLKERMLKYDEKKAKARQAALKRWEKKKPTALPPQNKTYSQEVETIYDFALSYFPKKLHPDTEKRKNNWKETIDKLMRIDKYDKKEMCRVIKWARQNEFWSKNFLSLTKLRQNNKEEVKFYEVFKNQMNNSKESIQTENPNQKKL